MKRSAKTVQLSFKQLHRICASVKTNDPTGCGDVYRAALTEIQSNFRMTQSTINEPETEYSQLASMILKNKVISRRWNRCRSWTISIFAIGESVAVAVKAVNLDFGACYAGNRTITAVA